MKWLTGLIVKLFVSKLEKSFGGAPALPDDPTVIANTCDSYGAQTMATAIYADLAHVLYNLINHQETLLAAAIHVIILLAALAIIWTRHAASRNSAKLDSIADQIQDKIGISIDVGQKPIYVATSPTQNFTPLLVAGLIGISAFGLQSSAFAADTNSAAGTEDYGVGVEKGEMGEPGISTPAPAVPVPSESLLSLLVKMETSTPAQAASPALSLAVNPKMAQAVDAVSWLHAIGQTTTIGGVETFLANGEYGSGVALAWQPIHADIKARTRLLAGPALVTASTRVSTRELLEVALATKVIDATAVQKAFKSIPLIGQLPIDISSMQAYLGVGLRVDADTKHVDRSLGVSIGVTSIKWGN